MRLSRRSEYGLRALTDLVRHSERRPDRAGHAGGPQSAAGQVPRADHGDAQARRDRPDDARARTAGTRSPRIRRRSRWDGSSGCSTGRWRRSSCVSLRYYEPCSCPDEGDLRAARHDARRPRRDARDPRRARRWPSWPPGPAAPSIDPRWAPRRRAGRPAALVPDEAPQRRLDPLLERARDADVRQGGARRLAGLAERVAQRLERGHDLALARPPLPPRPSPRPRRRPR